MMASMDPIHPEEILLTEFPFSSLSSRGLTLCRPERMCGGASESYRCLRSHQSAGRHSTINEGLAGLLKPRLRGIDRRGNTLLGARAPARGHTSSRAF